MGRGEIWHSCFRMITARGEIKVGLPWLEAPQGQARPGDTSQSLPKGEPLSLKTSRC